MDDVQNIKSGTDRSPRLLDHDLQAQLINVKSLSQEIELSASELGKIFSEDVTGLDAEVAGRLDELINDDLLPCIQFLLSSSSKLDQVVADFRSATLTASADGGS